MSCCKHPKFHLHFRKMFLYKILKVLCFIKYILCISRSESCHINDEIGKLLQFLKHWVLNLLFLMFCLLKYLCNTPTSMCIRLTRIYYNQPLQSTDSGDLKYILNRFVLFALLHLNVVYFLKRLCLQQKQTGSKTHLFYYSKLELTEETYQISHR